MTEFFVIHEVEYDHDEVKKQEDLLRQLAIKVTTGSFIERGEASRELDMLMRLMTGVSKARYVAAYVKMLLDNGEPVLWDAVADRIGGKILVNYQKVKSMSLEKLTNTLSHECAHLKDLSFTSKKMTDQYGKIINTIEKSKNEVQNALTKYGSTSSEYQQAYAKYSKYFTKYQYHYREMLANNSKVLQSLSRNARELIGQFGVPETQKMVRTMKDGLKKGIPQNIDYYLGKLIGKDNAEYIRQIRVYDKNLYQDLLKKLSKQIDYMEEQLKLYQQI
jgi:hypothetical protein